MSLDRPHPGNETPTGWPSPGRRRWVPGVLCKSAPPSLAFLDHPLHPLLLSQVQRGPRESRPCPRPSCGSLRSCDFGNSPLQPAGAGTGFQDCSPLMRLVPWVSVVALKPELSDRVKKSRECADRWFSCCDGEGSARLTVSGGLLDQLPDLGAVVVPGVGLDQQPPC